MADPAAKSFAYIYPNYVSRGYCTAGATNGIDGLIPTDLGPEWLKTEEPSDLARLTTVDPLYTQWFLDFAGVYHDIKCMAAVNTNISKNGFYRFTGHNARGLIYGPIPLKPDNSSIGSTNTVSDISDIGSNTPYDPGPTFIGPTITSAEWGLHLGWPTLPLSPLVGANMCQIVLSVGVDLTGGNLSTVISFPKLTVELWESGVLVSVLGERAVSETEQILILPFDASTLSDESLEGLEIKLNFSYGISQVVGMSVDVTFAKLFSVDLYYEHTANLYDTGWVQSPLGGFAEDFDGRQPTKSCHYLAPNTWTDVLSINYHVLDDQCGVLIADLDSVFPGFPRELIYRPSGFTQVGVVPAGLLGPRPEANGVERGFTMGRAGPGVRPEVTGFEGTTVGGQSYGFDNFRRRVTDSLELILTEYECLRMMDQIGWRKGHSGAVYIMLEPFAPVANQLFTAFWATCSDMGSPQPIGAGRTYDDSKDLFILPVTFKEKL